MYDEFFHNLFRSCIYIFEKQKVTKSKVHNSFQIVNISRSSDSLSIKEDKVPEEVKFSLLPYLILNIKESIATVILSSQFVNKKGIAFSNELIVQVIFKFEKKLPITQGEKDTVKIQNYEELLSIIGITVGTFRGILYEWLKGSQLQHPLPYIDIEEFIKGLRISFSK